MITTLIRPARPDEAAQLTALALRSKAFWGYDAAFMLACVPALTLTPERIQTAIFRVADEAGTVVGFYGLSVSGADAELTHLFVDASAIGRGHGRRLWSHALAAARGMRARHVHIESDPYAEAFYVGLGARRVGEAPSEAIPGRMLPVLVYDISAVGSSETVG